jgi:DNA-binding MarR family transcriptional regulator
MEERFQAFTVLVSNLNRCIYKIKTEEMAEYNLKSSHVSCIYYIYRYGSLTPKELCDLCGEDKANISRTLKYLEENQCLDINNDSNKKY